MRREERLRQVTERIEKEIREKRESKKEHRKAKSGSTVEKACISRQSFPPLMANPLYVILAK